MKTDVGPFGRNVTTFENIGISQNIAGVIGKRSLPLRSGVAFPPDSPLWAFNVSGGKANNAHVPPVPVPADAPLIAGTYIYGGPIYKAFGHVMAEFVHRLWITELPEYRDLPVAFIATEGIETPRFLGQIMELLGIRSWTVLKGPARVERLVVAEQGKIFRLPAPPDYTAFLQRRVGPLARTAARFPPRLAVLRGHLDPNTGRCFAETWLAEQLEAQGYLYFKPEEHPIADQANAYLHAEHIVFSEGSAMHLFDVLPPVKARIAVLNRRPGAPLGEVTLAGKCAALHVYDDLVFLGDPREHLTRSLSLLDPMKFLAFLQQHGFIAQLPERDVLDDAQATADDLAAFVKARHRSPKVRLGDDKVQLLAETIAFLVRQTVRPPTPASLRPDLAAARHRAEQQAATQRQREERDAARAERMATRNARALPRPAPKTPRPAEGRS